MLFRVIFRNAGHAELPQWGTCVYAGRGRVPVHDVYMDSLYDIDTSSSALSADASRSSYDPDGSENREQNTYQRRNIVLSFEVVIANAITASKGRTTLRGVIIVQPNLDERNMIIAHNDPANKGHWNTVVLMLGQRQRQWPNIKTTLV